jgi:transposase-like protein
MGVVASMLKAIYAQEDKESAREKAKAVGSKLRTLRLGEAADKLEKGIEETLTYMEFPSAHWTKLRSTNMIERVNREVRRRTRVVGAFPDGNSALMLVCARLRYISGTHWGTKQYMSMKWLDELTASKLAS